MKSIFKLSALALLATALTVSCEKEMSAPEEAPAEKVVRTFTCTFAQPDTRLAVAEDGKTQWEVGDEIMIHGGENGASRQLVTLTANDISADGKTATIQIVDMAPYDRTDAGVVSQYYAQYPARLVPEGNLYYECRFNGSTDDFLMAACDVEDKFVFYNLCGLITYKVSGDFTSVVFTGNNGETVTYKGDYQVRVRLDNGKDAPSVNYNKPGNGSGDALGAKTNEYAVTPDGTTLHFVFLPAGVNFTDGFTFKFYKGDTLMKIATTSKAVNIKPGQILSLGDITEQLSDYTPPTTSDHKSEIPLDGATDLSGITPANCYVIEEAGTYKFYTYKGNSAEEAGNVFGAEIVWETYNNDAEVVPNSVIAAVDFEDNWIVFKTPETLKPGNAVIAAKNAEDKIIWSWHIWIPETHITEIDATTIAGAKVLDRNLGALVITNPDNVVVESYGLFYQWGRKDPFPGAKRLDSSTLATIAGTPFVLKDQSKEEWIEGDTVKGTMTVGEAIQNPTMFGNNSGGHWDASANTTLWTAGAKSVYDPCPAGYRVMDRDKTVPLWDTTNIANAAAAAGMTWNSSLEGHWFSVTDGSVSLVFPLAGYIDDSDVKNVPYVEYPGKRAAVFCTYWGPYHLNIREDKTDYHKAGSTSGARGCSIRCVVE